MKKYFTLTLSCLFVSGVLNAQNTSAYNAPENRNELLPIEEVSIYPNPSTKGIINVSGLNKFNSTRPIYMNILNLNGKLIKHIELSSQSGISEISIEELLEGEYTIRLETDKQIFRSRLIVTD